MSVYTPEVSAVQLNAAYQQQRVRLGATAASAAALLWGQLHTDRAATIQQIVALVDAGQQNIVRLVEAYMAQRQLLATGNLADLVELELAAYTTEKMRGLPAAEVYARPFGAYAKFLSDGADEADAVRAAQASVSKLAATDLQLAQTHSARDWMSESEWVVGYRRVLTGAHSCDLCTLASQRTYRTSELMPIHEHCDCGIEPLWGHEPVASVGTTVRVENDPELGPRLMADNWRSVGPRLIEQPA